VLLDRGDRSGTIRRVQPDLLLALCARGFVPMISPPAWGGAAGPLNVNADRLAAAVAAALSAHTLVLLSDVPGLVPGEGQDGHVPEIAPGDGLRLPWVTGGMRLKLIAADEAIAAGVSRVVIADGRVPSPVNKALAGAGTVVSSPVEVRG
jgi:[amino group carrier protein]-L-2-aminoadipate 6-kinase